MHAPQSPSARSSSMRRAVEDRIAAHAAAQHGVVTRSQLITAGISPSAVDRRLACGRYRALHAGVYLTLPFPVRYTREMAAVLASGPEAVASHVSAAPLWEMRAPADGPIDVIAPGNRGRRGGIRVHRIRLPDAERTLQHRVPVTTPARTLLDLAGVLELRELEAVLARAEREGLVRAEELGRLLERHPGQRGVLALRSVLELPSGPAFTRSAAEAEFLALVREAEIPTPECNVKFGRHELDFFWRRARIAVEVDGFRYHGTRQGFERDRGRDADLVAAGVTVLRLCWRQLTDKRVATAVKLGQALALAGNRK